MKKATTHLGFTFLALLFVATACKQEKKASEEKETTVDTTEVETPTTPPEITLQKLEGSPAYADASLLLDTPQHIKVAEVGEVDFSFAVENYELGKQTEGPNAQSLANSGKGQHIHFILDNQPYSAHYEPIFQKEIPAGTHHLVAFLSRSYHESVKNENSVIVRKLTVGDTTKDTLDFDLKAPTLIYSRPKGTYKGKDTEQILLDFFVLNTTLSESGTKVRTTINGKQFMVEEWVPHVIKGLPMGEVTIQLELTDTSGNLIPGPFNSVTRKVTLEP
ncbi:hypothetical protein NBT05_09190 [Aquimarina sp. ERC-38]|uniref:hypothetical protein n=1 Tax=Aquimarina sp. ERC-38 TaxID=2949996 RepID=UPI002247E91B|nr:hypothetical protein [Aquimarina sp. ERC-38]UZO79145.1 hypothetical protein NBT05_09190 [Aquimarina sp. ERC-38]